MAVLASEVGDPTSFLWDAVNVYWPSPPGSTSFKGVDFLDPFWNPWPSSGRASECPHNTPRPEATRSKSAIVEADSLDGGRVDRFMGP
jgi:hypothetical protein